MEESLSNGVDDKRDLQSLAPIVLSSSTTHRVQALEKLRDRTEASGRSTF